MISILVVGNGRMGQQLRRVIEERENLELIGLVGQDNKQDLLEKIPVADVVIDFSHKEMLPFVEVYVKRSGAALVSGTTGYVDTDNNLIKGLSKNVPVIQSSNYSLGVAVLRHVAAQAAAYLSDWDIEIVEAHHNLKVDAPSGTAKSLLEAVQTDPEKAVVHGREGMIGPRPASEIGMHALRGGTVAGTHTVHFFGSQEEIELTHRANDRVIFALGAVAAAEKLKDKPVGMYTFDSLMFN